MFIVADGRTRILGVVSLLQIATLNAQLDGLIERKLFGELVIHRFRLGNGAVGLTDLQRDLLVDEIKNHIVSLYFIDGRTQKKSRPSLGDKLSALAS